MKRIAFLCSGGGGNLRFVWGLAKSGLLPCEVCGVFADRPCGAAEFGEAQGMTVLGPPMLATLERLAPDLIISNYHKLIPPKVVQAYPRRIINLHYSLLPAFGGLGMIGIAPVLAALSANCSVTGTTVHYVDERIDAGEIISQTVVPLRPGEPIHELMGRVFRSGCANLFDALSRLL